MAERRVDGLPWLPVAVAVAVAVGGWRRADRLARRAARELSAQREHAARAHAELEQAREQARSAASSERDKLQRERAMVARLRQSWRAEREFSRELRGQIARLYEHGALDPEGEDADTSGSVPELVLRAAIKLLEAEKGLLLSRADADGDGELDLVVSVGFDGDVEHSTVAQRFARRVLERDEIVREDAPATRDGEGVPADAEIDSLVAVPFYQRDRFSGVVICANRPGGFEALGDEMLLALGDHAGVALNQGRLRNELRDARRSVVRVLVEAVRERDPARHRETEQLAIHAVMLADDLDLDPRTRDVLVCATLLRGVGELALEDRILRKPGALSAAERSVVELHPRIAFNVVGRDPGLRDVATALLYHHERWDGCGYPAGLAGAEIPIAARALAVLEVYAAIVGDRPYRPPRPPEQACDILVAQAGAQLDPEITQLVVEQVRSGPPTARAELAESMLEALPLDAGAPGSLDGAATDALTLLGNHRALLDALRHAAQTASTDQPFAVALVELEDLPGLNRDSSPLAGDRLIQSAARTAQRVAGRAGGHAYRASGRRLAILAPLGPNHSPQQLLEHLELEFASGPKIRTGISIWTPGQHTDEPLRRARDSLR